MAKETSSVHNHSRGCYKVVLCVMSYLLYIVQDLFIDYGRYLDCSSDNSSDASELSFEAPPCSPLSVTSSTRTASLLDDMHDEETDI